MFESLSPARVISIKEVSKGVKRHSSGAMFRMFKFFAMIALSIAVPFASVWELPHNLFFAFESIQKIVVCVSFFSRLQS